jgi:uncharacterized lipoprotein YmbA
MKTTKTPAFPRPRFLFDLGLLAALAACDVIPPAQEDATRYFVLSERPPLAVDAGRPPGSLRIGLKTVKLEGYLKRREMVVRTGANEVSFKDYRRWADPLDVAITRSLRSALLGSPAVGQVYAEPFPLDKDRDFDVTVEILRFEGDASSGKFAASLSAAIEVSTGGPDGHVVSRKLFTAPAAGWDGSSYDQLASLLSADIGALGEEIVTQVPARTGP